MIALGLGVGTVFRRGTRSVPIYIEGAAGRMASGVAQTVTLPTGLRDDDIMFIHHWYSTANNNITVGTDSGWARLEMQIASGIKLTVFWKKYQAGQAATVNMSYDGAMEAFFHTFAVRGLKQSGPIGNKSFAAYVASTPYAIPTFNSTVQDSVILIVNGSSSTTTSPTFDNGFGLTANGIAGPTTLRAWAVYSKTASIVGAVGATNVSFSGDNSSLAIELIPE